MLGVDERSRLHTLQGSASAWPPGRGEGPPPRGRRALRASRRPGARASAALHLDGQRVPADAPAEEALWAFDQALERAPSDRDAMRGKAAALEAAGRDLEAGAMRMRAAELEAMARAGERHSATADPLALELESHVSNGAAARAAGDLDVAVMAYLTAASGYAAVNDCDAAIDACLRALEARPGNIDVHFTMAMLYLRQGWVEHGEQRALLIERRLDIDDDPRRRAALCALARDFRSLSPQLERLASARP